MASQFCKERLYTRFELCPRANNFGNLHVNPSRFLSGLFINSGFIFLTVCAFVYCSWIKSADAWRYFPVGAHIFKLKGNVLSNPTCSRSRDRRGPSITLRCFLAIALYWDIYRSQQNTELSFIAPRIDQSVACDPDSRNSGTCGCNAGYQSVASVLMRHQSMRFLLQIWYSETKGVRRNKN